MLTVYFSSRTTSLDIQRNLEANVEKRTKDTYGPPMGKRLLVFMDDMNMPKVGEVWGSECACACRCVCGASACKNTYLSVLRHVCRAQVLGASLGHDATGLLLLDRGTSALLVVVLSF